MSGRFKSLADNVAVALTVPSQANTTWRAAEVRDRSRRRRVWVWLMRWPWTRTPEVRESYTDVIQTALYENALGSVGKPSA